MAGRTTGGSHVSSIPCPKTRAQPPLSYKWEGLALAATDYTHEEL